MGYVCPPQSRRGKLPAPKGQAKHVGILTQFQTEINKKISSMDGFWMLDSGYLMLDERFVMRGGQSAELKRSNEVIRAKYISICIYTYVLF